MTANQQIFEQISNTTLIGQAVHQLASNASAPSQASLDVSGAATSGETYVINGVTYELLGFTDSTENVAGGDLNNLTNPVDVLFTAHGRTVGEFLLVEAEFLEVTKVIDVNNVRVSRGAMGSTPATHVDTTNIFENTTVPTAGEESIGLTDVATAATVVTDIVQAHNAINGRETTAIDSGGDVIVFTADPIAGTGRPTTEAMANGAFLNGTAMELGTEKGEGFMAMQTRTIATGETAGGVRFAFNFTLQNAIIVIAGKLYDGDVTLVGNVAVPDNAGAVDVADADVVTCIGLG